MTIYEPDFVRVRLFDCGSRGIIRRDDIQTIMSSKEGGSIVAWSSVRPRTNEKNFVTDHVRESPEELWKQLQPMFVLEDGERHPLGELPK